MSKFYKETVLDDINFTGKQLADITVSVLQEEDGTYTDVTVSTFEDLLNYMLHLYGNRIFLSKHLHEPTNSEITNYFVELWNDFYNSVDRQKNWGMVYSALYKKYDPMENYDKYSTISLDKTGMEVSTYNNGQNGYTDTVKTSVSPDVSESYYNSQKSETEYGARVETTEHSFDDRVDTTTEHTHGNIGTTKAMDMYVSEKQARLNSDVLDLLLQQFIYQFTY